MAAKTLRPTKYGNYDGVAPRISLVLTPLDDANLQLAAQVGQSDHWIAPCPILYVGLFFHLADQSFFLFCETSALDQS